jgi:hypothetical protein
VYDGNVVVHFFLTTHHVTIHDIPVTSDAT